MKNKLFLPVFGSRPREVISVPVETFISTFVLNYCDNIKLNIVEVVLVSLTDYPEEDLNVFSIPESCFGSNSVVYVSREHLPKRIQDCTLPALEIEDKVTYIGGLCAVLRQAIKPFTQSELTSRFSSLLGFRGNCLTACSEVSLWTKFCEIDLPGAVNTFIRALNDTETSLLLPKELMKFEQHLALPVRTHNILKRKQNIVRTMKGNVLCNEAKNAKSDAEYLSHCIEKLNIKSIKKNCTDVELEHIFAEGIDKTLADLILLPCVHLILIASEKFGCNVPEHIPHVHKWYKRMFGDQHVQLSSDICGWTKYSPISRANVLVQVPTVPKESLYSRDPKRKKIRIRNQDPRPIIKKLTDAGIEPTFSCHPCEEVDIDWHCLPMAAHPAGGDLPLSRVDRKCQQVESIVTAVLNIAEDGDVIVDFCSGGGHVGIVLAYYLPTCHVVMIENKEASLERARRRASDLQLDNVVFYQCNLDYYQGNFDIAVALHACGVSTDLVIQKSLDKNAHFVCCPCCYGYISNTQSLQYPRSSAFTKAGILYEDYLMLCHCADRTEVGTKEETEGKPCMAFVDTDRCLHARERGYKAVLCTLIPPDCTPKSNLLISIKQKL